MDEYLKGRPSTAQPIPVSKLASQHNEERQAADVTPATAPQNIPSKSQAGHTRLFGGKKLELGALKNLRKPSSVQSFTREPSKSLADPRPDQAAKVFPKADQVVDLSGPDTDSRLIGKSSFDESWSLAEVPPTRAEMRPGTARSGSGRAPTPSHQSQSEMTQEPPAPSKRVAERRARGEAELRGEKRQRRDSDVVEGVHRAALEAEGEVSKLRRALQEKDETISQLERRATESEENIGRLERRVAESEEKTGRLERQASEMQLEKKKTMDTMAAFVRGKQSVQTAEQDMREMIADADDSAR